PGVVQLLGGNIRIISSLFVYKHPLDPLGQRTIRTPEMTGWHRDMREVVRDLGHECIERYSVMASYFLSDLRVEGLGSSLFVRGSHRLREALYVPPDRADPEECVSIPVEPGDAILFENRTWHAGQLNTSKRDDKILFIQYAYRWLAPVDYWNVNPELASQLTDIESQLLGLTTDVDRGGNFVLGSGSAAIEKWAASAGIEPRHHPYYGPRR
ncbi:MAG: phytanoyl-CoA dioxygenase family protein, partial [Deltaproteobacteria bacterium]|nr:phytanoyl-CoA dioxygenase family protein [Deltaproteobacteria bacterium]